MKSFFTIVTAIYAQNTVIVHTIAANNQCQKWGSPFCIHRENIKSSKWLQIKSSPETIYCC